MRQVIDEYLFSKKDAILLVADFGHFPLMETTNRYYNIGLSETLLINSAIGLALAGKHVFIYSAANFTLYRAYEQLKLYLDEKNNLNITILNGGAGFCYSSCGKGHYLTDDLKLISLNLQNINIYLPYDAYTTKKAMTKSFKSINYIRLCLDSSPAKIKLTKLKNTHIVIAFGWLVPHINNILQKHNINIALKTELLFNNAILLIKNNKKAKVIIDNTSFFIANGINVKFLEKIIDKTGYSRLQVLKMHQFDEKTILKFITK